MSSIKSDSRLVPKHISSDWLNQGRMYSPLKSKPVAVNF